MEWFEFMPQGYWKDIQNRRNFLENFARKNGISKPSDWGNVTIQQIKESGGNSLLKCYSGSLIKTLEGVFPGSIFS